MSDLKKLPEAVRNAYVLFKSSVIIEDLLEKELNGEEMEGFDVDYDDLSVDYEEEDTTLDFSGIIIKKLIIWTKSRVLVWDDSWKYFRNIPRNPDEKKTFKIRRR